MENPRIDITVAPEFSMMIFGDGYIALIQGATEQESEDGEEIIRFTIKPSGTLRKRYNIRDEQLDSNGNIQDYIVSKKDLIHLNIYDDANRRILYIKTIEHKETEISKVGWDLRKRLEQMEKRVIVLEGELIWLSEQLQLAKTNPMEFASQGIELWDRMGDTFSKLKDKPAKGDA